MSVSAARIDPASGTGRAQVSSHGQALSLREILRYLARLAQLIRRHWPGLFRGVILTLIVALFSMAGPYVSKLLIDNAYPARDVGLMEALVTGLLVLTISTTWMSALQGYFGQIIQARLGSATALLFFNHVQHLPVAFFDTHQVGEVLSRFTDVRSAIATFSNAFETVLTSILFLVLVPPFLVFLNWKLALLSVVVVPLTTAVTILTSRYVRRYYQQSAEGAASLSAYQTEALSQMRNLKAMALEQPTYDRVSAETHTVVHSSLRAARVQSIVMLVNGTVRGIGTCAFTWFAWTLIFRGELTLGGFIAFTSYLAYLTTPLTRITTLVGSLQQSSVSLARMFEYLDLPVEQDPTSVYIPRAHVTKRLCGDIRFNRVSFGYTPSTTLLRSVNLWLPAESITVVTGTSGSGKSTLLRLVPRFVQPESGTISIGDVGVSDVSLSELRRQVAVVWQEPFMVRSTLLENLLLGAPTTARPQVDRVLEVCQLSDVVARLTRGVDTKIAEWGATLSGGERQRIAIARALLRDTPTLLLDEATANLDEATESALLSGLRAEFASRTILLVSHRHAVLKYADRVVRIEDGSATLTGCDQQEEQRQPTPANSLTARAAGIT